MKIFKFGGASTKDAESVKNVVSVIAQTGEKDLVIIISAMGKTTNALEEVVQAYFSETGDVKNALHSVYDFHYKILTGLFSATSHPAFAELDKTFKELKRFLETNKSKNHAFVYDQVVSFGELISSKIVSAYFSEHGIHNTWLDVRQCIKTDANYRDANVDWEKTQENITEKVSKTGITLTQGFLGSETSNNFTTTLGREGSDYTAAIFAYCLNAENVTIWKDVPGVMNADPKTFPDTQLLPQLSYKECIELAFYGASIIHPKTIQPLQNKEIPLFVRSFIKFKEPGTLIDKNYDKLGVFPKYPSFILKRNQILMTIRSRDFSFIMDNNISEIFNVLHKYKIKVSLIQQTAITLSLCVNDKYNNFEYLYEELKESFSIKYNEEVILFTFINPSQNQINYYSHNKKVLLRQETRNTVQIVFKK